MILVSYKKGLRLSATGCMLWLQDSECGDHTLPLHVRSKYLLSDRTSNLLGGVAGHLACEKRAREKAHAKETLTYSISFWANYTVLLSYLGSAPAQRISLVSMFHVRPTRSAYPYVSWPSNS